MAGAPARLVGSRGLPWTAVVIVTCGNYDRLDRCLTSIEKYTGGRGYRVIVVDNGSTDGLLKQARSDHRIWKLIRSEQNLGFGAGANLGIEFALRRNANQSLDHCYIALLNDDIEVTEGWLDGLLDAMKQFPNAAIVGPVSDNVSGSQKVAVGEITGAKEPYVTSRLVAFCWLMRSYYVRKFGVFDPRFGVGNFEDDDLCIRALQHGYSLYICPKSFVHHEGHATFNDLGVDLGASLLHNWEIFKEKWGLPGDLPYGAAVNLEVKAAPLED